MMRPRWSSWRLALHDKSGLSSENHFGCSPMFSPLLSIKTRLWSARWLCILTTRLISCCCFIPRAPKMEQKRWILFVAFFKLSCAIDFEPQFQIPKIHQLYQRVLRFQTRTQGAYGARNPNNKNCFITKRRPQDPREPILAADPKCQGKKSRKDPKQNSVPASARAARTWYLVPST